MVFNTACNKNIASVFAIDTEVFEFGEGKKVYPGMTKENFLECSELVKEIIKGGKDSHIVFLKNQKIGEYELSMLIQFNKVNEVQLIILQKPGYFDGVNLLIEKEALATKRYLDKFLESQIVGEYNDSFTLLGKIEWGCIKSIYDYSDVPHIMIQIAYL